MEDINVRIVLHQEVRLVMSVELDPGYPVVHDVFYSDGSRFCPRAPCTHVRHRHMQLGS